MDIEKLAKKHEAEFTDWQDGREAEIAFYGGVSQLERFAEAYHQAKCNEEIQTLRAKVASADVLVEALKNSIQFISGSVRIESNSFDDPPSPVSEWDYQADMLALELNEALATYDKLSEVKHDTK